jgi:hypothetical protein
MIKCNICYDTDHTINSTLVMLLSITDIAVTCQIDMADTLKCRQFDLVIFEKSCYTMRKRARSGLSNVVKLTMSNVVNLTWLTL